MGTHITWSACVDHMFAGRYFSVIYRLDGDLVHIIAYGFRKAGGVNCNDVRFIGCENIVNGLEQVGLAPEDR